MYVGSPFFNEIAPRFPGYAIAGSLLTEPPGFRGTTCRDGCGGDPSRRRCTLLFIIWRKRSMRGYRSLFWIDCTEPFAIPFHKPQMGSLAVSRFRHMPESKIEEFLCKGYQKRHFFPHKIYYLPKC